MQAAAVNNRVSGQEREVLFIASVTWRLDRKKLASKHFDGFFNSSGKGVRCDDRLIYLREDRLRLVVLGRTSISELLRVDR